MSGESQSRPHGDASQAKHEEPPDQALEKVLSLLGEVDDTSRLAGLTLLKPQLVEYEQNGNHKAVEKCWRAVPFKFVNRLLKTVPSEKIKKEDADNLVGIAVGLLNTFLHMGALTKATQDSRLAASVDPLIIALRSSSSEVRRQISGILLLLLTETSTLEAMWQSKHWSTLVELALSESSVLNLLKYVFIVANSKVCNGIEERMHQTILQLISLQQSSNHILKFFEFTNAVISKDMLPGENQDGDSEQPKGLKARNRSPQWLPSLTDLIHQTVVRTEGKALNSGEACSVVGPLITTLLNMYTNYFPRLLFCSTAGEDRLTFINSVIIELRSSVPSLQHMIHDADYYVRSAQLAACYDVLSSFIGYLLSTLDAETEDDPSFETVPALQDPTTLLRLRRDISETMSLTIEHLRERFDASNAGAKGLHPDSRARDPSTYANGPLSLTLEDPSSMAQDPLTLAEIRALALWLRDDDNDTLRNEAAGLMDLFIHLYRLQEDDHAESNYSNKADNDNGDDSRKINLSQDFKVALPIALSGVLQTPIGVEAFLAEDGWEVMAAEVESSTKRSAHSHGRENIAVAAAQVLQLVIEADVTGPTKQDWMPLIKVAESTITNAAASRPAASHHHHHHHQQDQERGQRSNGGMSTELAISMGHLAAALYEKAPSRLQRQYKTSMASLERGVHDLIETTSKSQVSRADQESLEDLEDLIDTLRSSVV